MLTAPRRATWHRGQVVRQRPETGTAARIELDVPTWPGNHAGSHLDIRLTAPDGYQASRSYSIVSSGNTTRVILAVDEVPTGEVSPYLVRDLAEGESVEVLGPLGGFFIWDPSDADLSPVQLIAGGSGVVPLYSMAAARERASAGGDFRLLYSVRSPGDVFFRDELAQLASTAVELVYTRESPPGSARPAGRLTRDALAAAMFPPSSAPRIFVSGPTPFVEAVAGWLIDLGHESTRIRTERFGGS